MHVIDDVTMQEMLRFVKAHHTFARHNRVFRERILELLVMLQQLENLVDRKTEKSLMRVLVEHEERLLALEHPRHRAPRGNAPHGKEA